MNVNAKPKSQHTDASQNVQDEGARRAKEAFEKAGTATSDTAEMVTNFCSTALNGMQQLNGKLIEFAHANLKSHAELLQKLAAVRSPTEFLDLSTSHNRRQLEQLTDQAKQLTDLTKQAAFATAEPVKIGLAKVYDRSTA